MIAYTCTSKTDEVTSTQMIAYTCTSKTDEAVKWSQV